jgi:predicted flap endonuclease-1-like 5' DNA nuclease
MQAAIARLGAKGRRRCAAGRYAVGIIGQLLIREAPRWHGCRGARAIAAAVGTEREAPGKSSRQPGSEESLMDYPITQIDGLGEEDVEKLKSVGIRTTNRLLEQAKSPKGRGQLAARIGLPKGRILSLANAADRLRIKGMGKGYSSLLEAVGVNTVRELRYRNPSNLAAAMAELNKKRKLVRFLPSEKLVTRWVRQANELSPKITYR